MDDQFLIWRLKKLYVHFVQLDSIVTLKIARAARKDKHAAYPLKGSWMDTLGWKIKPTILIHFCKLKEILGSFCIFFDGNQTSL
jgi:hypothetical protein